MVNKNSQRNRKKIMDDFKQHYQDEDFKAEAFFKFHADPEVSSTAVEMLIDRYQFMPETPSTEDKKQNANVLKKLFNNESKIVMLGMPYDGTCSYRPGTRFAPEEIRLASWGLEEYSPDIDREMSEISFYDAGELDLPFGNRDKILETIKENVQNALDDDKKVVAPEFSYSFYPVYAGYYGIELEKVPLKSDFSLDVEKMLEFGKDSSGMIFANPNAPFALAPSSINGSKITSPSTPLTHNSVILLN